MKYAALLLLAIVLPVPIDVPRQPPEKPKIEKPQNTDVDISGYYIITGTQNDDKYRGACVVYKIPKGGYLLVYTVEAEQYKGVGVRNGQMMSVGWSTDKLKGSTLFRISDDGKSWHGVWTSIPVANGTETFHKVKDEN